LSVNSPLGIFGDLTSENYKRNKKYLIANNDEVKTGKAVMVTTPVGATPQNIKLRSKEYATVI
jgi:stage IV sporulation protein B